MAPSRRKVGSKASAAAAAARRQWKVGDLVLAKVKGFPAWPATVSEPEKWGYSADWKKVLVYFFGTKQIAFCNPADVEAFTEEKKEALLIKRHGKGADFVRAVHEIIESYEKSKKREEIADFNSGDEVTVTNAGISVEPLYDVGVKDQTEAPAATLISSLRSSCSFGDKNESIIPVEDVAAATQADALHNGEASSEELTDNLVVNEKPPSTSYSSRKRSGVIQSRSHAMQKRVPHARRSRNSSRVEFHRLQKLIVPSSNGNKSAVDVPINALQDGSVRRSKRIRNSQDVTEVHGAGSPAFVSNGSIEENGSEIVTVDSDTFSLNDGSTVESGCEIPQPDSAVECCEGDIELSQTLDFQTKSSFIKKKRKPNRKRVNNDTIAGQLDNLAGSEMEVQRSGPILPDAHERSNDRYPKDDGDEHLPLVKRARVRMGRPSSAGGEVATFIQSEDKSSEVSNSLSERVCVSVNADRDSPADGNSFTVKGVQMDRPSSAGGEVAAFIQSEDKSSEVSNSLSERVCISVNGDRDSPADGNSFTVKGVMDHSSPSNKCCQFYVNNPRPLEGKKGQQTGSLVDDEAALPPSKRLHRALEAMSANAAEDGKKCSGGPSTMKTFINGSFSSTSECSYMSIERKSQNGCRMQNVDSFCNNDSEVGISGLATSSNPPVPEESAKSYIEVAICNISPRTSNSPKYEFHDMLDEAVDFTDRKDYSVRSLAIQTAEPVVVQTPKLLSPNLARNQACLGHNEGALGQMLPCKDECKNENSELSNHRVEEPVQELDPSKYFRMSSSPVSTAAEIAKVSPPNGVKLLLNSVDGTCESTNLWKLPLDENNQVNGMCEVVKEIKPSQKDSNTISSPNLVKVLVAAVQGSPHLSHSVSISDDHLDDKDVSGIRSSSSPTDGLHSPPRASPPNTSIRPMSASDNSNFLENNGGCSPDVQLRYDKSKDVDKWNNKAEVTAASLASFEAILRTLTRTKENIGRATRIAIDCGKFGTAAKVVEILARNLERESNLHKKVDLFFLVDSITQCSRGLKGDVAGVYPSAIQAVLPRLLLAAAPPGSSARENRRQCLKVLRVWLERKILPESIIRHHIRDLDSFSSSSSSGAFSRRPLRTERAFDDPLREMEGTIVNEYGSNSSFQLPGFRMPPMRKDEDEGSDSDGGSFEAVTPEHNSETPEEQQRTVIPAIEKHRHILEDVDGELEMEDVAPSFETDLNVAGVNSAQPSHHQFEQQFPQPFAPPLPDDVPPSSPPLPTSPPPPPPPPPPLPLSCLSNPVSNGVDAKLFMGTHNIKENLQQSNPQQSIAPGISSTISDTVHYRDPKCRDLQMQMHIPDSGSSYSFSSVPISHPPIQQLNSVQPTDGMTLENKAYHLRPPHPAPSNQFSYVQTDQSVQSRREVPPPSFPNRFHFLPNREGNFYSDHDRMKLAPHDPSESWRFSVPSFSGSYYPDNAMASYGPAPYPGPPCEPAIPNYRWGFPHRAINHSEFIPNRPPSEGPIPVAAKAQSFWQPR
ncbi:protein HUA2-LIKE 2-like isoform X1 [Cornus florida]|uniref:protein HUA2-LIKE 2-like isoform X1 n=1 Tax=Cornus florida TaxID=4283 RepID=UPI002897FF90|nr:protein HUA2-LIKE 2-like isoform X1 [Cornus florida]